VKLEFASVELPVTQLEFLQELLVGSLAVGLLASALLFDLLPNGRYL
jgi:hypothetical protein